MPKPKKNKPKSGSTSGAEKRRPVSENDFPCAQINLGKNVKRLISFALVAYLFVVVIGPLSNPIGSEFLTRPLAKVVSPIHQILFLGHGYRFFGPDPAASHLVVYRVVDGEGNLTTRQFPDRESNRPRLMYHRWFMLSETIFNEHARTLDNKSYLDSDEELATQIEALKKSQHFPLSQRLERERTQLARDYQHSRERIAGLVSAIATELLQRHAGKRIELFVQERSIPFTVQVLTGTKISDKQFLSPLTKIGEYRLGDDGKAVSLEVVDAPASSGGAR